MSKKIYLFLFTVILTISVSFGQFTPSKISVFSDGKSFDEVLTAISSKYAYTFKYDTLALRKTNVSIDLTDKTVEEALNLIISKNKLKLNFIKNTSGEFEIFNPSIKKNKSISAKPVNSAIQNKDIKATRSNFTLTGHVVDLQSGERLPFTSISVKGLAKLGTTTNVDGYYTISNVPSDTVMLFVSYVGYLNKTVRLQPTDNVNDFIIKLEASSEELEELVVSAEKTEVIKANEVVGMIKMTPRNIAKLPNIGERDPFRAFQLMPGISASNESSAGLYVRGGTPDQTLVMYDGFTVYNVDHLFGFFSAFNYNAIKDIQLYKGGFDARFGGRISAVAEITGKQGNSNKLNAGIDVSLLSANAYIEAPIGKKLTFLLAARRSYKGPLYNKIFTKFTSNAISQQQQGPGRRDRNTVLSSQTAASYFYDLNAKLTYHPTKKDILAISTFNGIDNMDNSATNTQSFGGRGGQPQAIDVNSTTTDLAKWGNTGASFKWSRKWSEYFYSNSLMSYSNYFSERDNSRNLSFNRNGVIENQRLGRLETNSLSDLSAKLDFEYKLNPKNQLEFGAMFTQNTIDFNYTQNDTLTILNRNDKGQVINFYAQSKMQLLNGKLQIIPGLRLTNFNVTAKNYLEPRFSFNYNLMSKLKLKGALGTYYQFVKQINREDISVGNRNFWILADGSNLPVTKSNHIIIGASYEAPKYLFDVEFYQKQNSGISEYTLRFVPQINQGGGPRGGGGLKVSETFFNGRETIQGVDILIQRKYGDFNGWLGYTLAQATRRIAAFSDKPYYSDQDVRHQFKAVGLYKIKSFDLAATFIYATGRPYTSILGAYQLTLLDGTTKDFTNPSDKNAQRFIPYQRLDLSATYNFKRGSIGASIFNTLNRTNVWYKRFEIIREQGVSSLQVTDVTYLGITPNVTLSLKIK